MPLLGRAAHVYERLLRRATNFMRSPVACASRAPWETFGLAIARGVFSLPGLYCVGRPVLPVASAIVLAARTPEVFGSLPVALHLHDAQEPADADGRHATPISDA